MYLVTFVLPGNFLDCVLSVPQTYFRTFAASQVAGSAGTTGGAENVGRENDGHEIDGPICRA